MHLDIDRSDIRHHRISETPAAPAADGQVVLEVESMALTANNISYALSGDFLDYWGFFPTADGWGRLPAMAFGIVTESRVPGIDVGSRHFGFFPVGDRHVVTAQATSGGFVDIGPHREKHAMAYRSFDRVDESRFTDADPHGHAYLLLRGLFLTSYLAEDFLNEHDMHGAGQIVISSASSKTAIALARRIRSRGNTHCIALTSASNIDFVNRVNLYDEVVTYDDIESLAEWSPTVFVDMAGNASVTSRVHHHFGDALTYSCTIGATHWDQSGPNRNLPGPRPEFFFAPTQLAKRGKEWGRDVLNNRIDTALDEFIVDSRRWLDIVVADGRTDTATTYDDLVHGRVPASHGRILAF